MATPADLASGLRSTLRRLAENARASDWWEFKIPPLLATAYAAALLLQLSFAQLWPLLLLLLLVLLPGATYVSVINDITDLEDDLRCGKSNRMVGRSSTFRFGALAICLLPGVVACWLMRDWPVTLGLYAANWVAYTLYSAPPFRLKARGIWGVAMDAAGAHLLPTLWTASLMAEATGLAVPWLFLASLGVWSSALGLRGILWHQLYDRENDLRGKVETFAVQREPKSIRRFVARVAFPLEIAALGLILLQLNIPWAWVVLAIYLAVEWLACRTLGIDLIIVKSTQGFRIVFMEYYQLWYPLTFLVAMTQKSWGALLLIVLQLALFPHCFHLFVRHLNYIARQAAVTIGRRIGLIRPRAS